MQKISISARTLGMAAVCLTATAATLGVVYSKHEPQSTPEQAQIKPGLQVDEVPVYAQASEQALESLGRWQEHFEEEALYCAQDAQATPAQSGSATSQYRVTHAVVTNTEQLYTVVSEVQYACTDAQKGQAEFTLNLSKLTGEPINMAALLDAQPKGLKAHRVNHPKKESSYAVDADTANELEPLPYGVRAALQNQLNRNQDPLEQVCRQELSTRLAQKSVSYSDFDLTLTTEGLGFSYHQNADTQRVCRLGLMMPYEKLRAYTDLKVMEELGLKNLFFAPTNAHLGTGITVFSAGVPRLN